jgi:hypothetical protein
MKTSFPDVRRVASQDGQKRGLKGGLLEAVGNPERDAKDTGTAGAARPSETSEIERRKTTTTRGRGRNTETSPQARAQTGAWP